MHAWVHVGTLLSCGIALACCVVFLTDWGVASEDAVRNQGANQPATGPATSTAPSPAQAWAQSTLAVYQTALAQTVAVLEPIPAVAEALPRIQAVRDKCIEQLLALGRQREAMDRPVRAQADSAFLSALMRMEFNPDFKKFMQLAGGPYSATNAKTDDEKLLAKRVTGMNIITQYAQFELLKMQEPAEAERLGIK